MADGNQVLKQAAVGAPVKWLRDDVLPVAQLGDATLWGGTNLSVRVGLPAGSTKLQTAFAGVHVQIPDTDGTGVWAAISSDGDWWLASGPASQIGAAQLDASLRLTNGKLDPVPMPDADGIVWTVVELRVVDQIVVLHLNKKSVANVRATTSGGNVGVDSVQYAPAFYDDFAVSAIRRGDPCPCTSTAVASTNNL